VVFLEHLPPLAIDDVDFLAVVERIGPVLRESRIQVGLAPERFGEILRQRMCDVDTEAVGPPVGPEPERVQEVLPDLAIGPIEIRLFASEQMAVPLPIRRPLPRAATEV
jgi:hypothetical protein